ncbi:fatty acid hydroxylase [Methylovirgula ligni]|uniref:Sterol desaturase/sphingolipid hydroxylase (Fatty acid hydroxylase superfamily) n=1 Tax=Methylovirgula ligni TaxID=569860 RepID=A0A3D9YY56_9HYPH|nr:sterol desaturase family protein [Methylovirgula ligni]QAY96447.1 fatty acid hydroxylase [Methylovirgula ligni]REF85822.1 sterol desaturase/sphingolipid hydroxylase (fatty acid hydroxylase superfamily) [Methylovirgula ligni]
MTNPSLPAWLPLSVLTWIVVMVVFHGFGYVFEICDRAGLFKSSKVRRSDTLTYAQLLPRALFNQVFVLLPAMVLVQWLGWAFTGTAHLGIWRFIALLAGMAIGHDIVQYVTHRYLLHDPRLMRILGHSVHHTTGASKAISALYMAPADFFLEIVLPYLLPLVVLGGGGGDILFHLLVAGLGAFGGLYEHSGYDFAEPLRRSNFYKSVPWLGAVVETLTTSKAHGQHHTRGMVSFSDGFGSPGLCDTVFATRWDKVKERQPQRTRPQRAQESAPQEHAPQ